MITSWGYSTMESRGERRKVAWRAGTMWGCMLRDGQSHSSVHSTVPASGSARPKGLSVMLMSANSHHVRLPWALNRLCVFMVGWKVDATADECCASTLELPSPLSVLCRCRVCTLGVFLFCVKSPLLISLVGLRMKRTSLKMHFWLQIPLPVDTAVFPTGWLCKHTV